MSSIEIPQISTGIIGGVMFYDSNTPGLMGPTVVNTYTTLSIPSYWRAQNFIVNNLASFPRYIVRDGVKVKHRLDTILSRRPNSYQNKYTFWRTLFFHASHWGNGYAEIKRDGQFNPVSFDSHIPEAVFPFRWIDDSGQRQNYFYIGGKEPHVAAAADMIHLPGLSYDGFTGMNPVWMLSEGFERGRVVDRYITRFLNKGSVVRGSIEIPAGLGKDQQQTIVETLRAHFRGPDAERDLIVLSEGAKLTNNTLGNDQAQLIELTGYTTKQIAQITGVPPVFLFENSEAKYNSSVEEAWDMAARDLFRPLLIAYEAELTLKLLTPAEQDAGYEVKFDLKAVIKGNATVESTVVTQQKTSGIITTNEGRAVLGYPKSTDPNADKLETLGSSAPKNPVSAPAQPSPVKSNKAAALESFSAIIADAANRVETKTAKATETATKKHQAEALTRWSNVFAGEQSEYTTAALTPIFSTIADLTDSQPVDASKIGEAYATALRTHFSKVIRGEESVLPRLTQLISEQFADSDK